MKKILNILIVLFIIASASVQAQQTACCPEFKMVFKRDFDCTKQGSCLQGPIGNEEHFTASMCKYSTNTFLVVPNLPGYTYAWVITGGTPTVATVNPVSITWGGGTTGTIMVTITSADGKCKKTIKETICLRDAPVASFTFGPNNACAGVLISFNNTSVGGAGVSWNFGDGGFAGNVNNPTHTYAAPGTYNVTIYVTNDTTPCRPAQPGQGDMPCCGCTSSYTLQVTVVGGSPLLIVPKNCINQCLCAGDTAEYCLSSPCPGPITWTPSPGSTIISGQGTQCVKVKWGTTYPTTISVSAPNCGNPCGNTATLSVPVLVNNIPILPNTTTVCQFTTQTYSLPAMPGVFYNWVVTGGTIVGPNVNTSVITVMWGAGPTGQVSCTYNNPLKKNCSGSSVRNVSIKPVLKITGPSQSCVGCTANFFSLSGPVSWSGSPGLTFSPPAGTSTTVSFPVSLTTNTYTITATGAAGVYCNSPVSAFIVVAPKPIVTIAPTSAIACPNTPVKFVATSNVTTTPITWVLPAGATMIANTGPQLDTAVISFGIIPLAGAIVTATQNCAFSLSCSQGTASATVKKPQAPLLATPPNPCIDQTSSYSISNYIPGITYTWTISNNLGTITTGQGSGTITVLWHGNNAVANAGTITVSNCAGSVSVPVTVTLPVYPTITVGGTCIKTGMTLTSSTAGPYLWTGPGIVGSNTTQTININQPGQYCVTINAGAPGSCGQTKCIDIAPNPYFVKIIPPCIVSSCNPATLSVLLTVATNIPTPTNCQWLYQPPGGGPFTVVSTTCGNYTATLLGTYYMVILDPNGCRDTSNIIRIPQDINICCASGACNSIPANAINFTHTGCAPTVFTGSFTLPPGWLTGSLPINYCFGDGSGQSGPSLNATHQYAAAGLYNACIVRKIYRPSGVPGINDTCCVSNCHNVIIPVVTKFTAAYNCTGSLTMTDGSSYYPSPAGASYAWTVTPATYIGILTNAPNQSITPTASGNYTITLAITLNGCTSTYSLTVLVVLPAAPININPNPTCDGSPVFFSTTGGMASYNWQFGDNSFSLMASPQHIYPGPGTYTVTLTVVTPQGCTVIKTGTVTVQPKPIGKIAVSDTICPGTSKVLSISVIPNGNTMCPLISNYNIQWYNNGNPVGANTPTFTATNWGTYYAVLTGNNPACNCVITTDTITISWYPKPVAKIKGNSTVCINPNTGTGTVNLENTVSGYPTYNWSANSGAVTFNFNNIYNPIVTVTAAGNYQVFLQVIDANGCKAYDTLCLYATNSPTVFVNAPGGTLCSGNVYPLQAMPTPPTAPPAGYNYLWNNGAGTSTINVSAPGVYNVILTNMNTGCSALSNSVFIFQGPDLSLFPSCCDTICSTDSLIIVPPLPLGPGQNACTVYNIVWLDNGVPISPQPSPCNALNTATLLPLLGVHNISIAVTLNGCTDTSNVFRLVIIDCACDCKGSKWDIITLSPAKADKLPVDDPAGVKAGNPTSAVAPNAININCGKTYQLNCNKPYTINANYLCKDTACNKKVTYSLQPPTGGPITGTMPPALNFTPTQNGTYVLTMYGWCGDKICDTCIIKFDVKCAECECKGSKWGQQTLTIDNNSQTFKCGQNYDVKCKSAITVNANYLCAGDTCNTAVTYSLQPPAGGPVTGSLPLNFTALQTGTYTLTMYGWCGNKLCDSCVIKFTTVCKDCCPYDIKATTGIVKYDYTQIPNATVAAQTFTISGLALANITEVRANVVSYTIDDNYKKECMKCVNLPFTWASIASAANIGAVPGLITMYGGTTVPSFNGSGAGAYQNPREVIWNNGGPISIPNNTNIGINFILPPVPAIDCCELKGKICVKFTFRDKDCKECEVIVCFDFVIRKK